MWREPFHLQVAEEAETLFLVTEYHGTRIMLQPFCAEERETAAVEKIVAWFREQGQPCRFMGLEKSFAEKLAAMPAYHFELGTSENESDYVYLAEKLATLSGRKLHSKKNHLNAFRKLYPQAVYVPITEDILPACREVLDEWYQNRTHTTEKDDPFIATERKGILEVFDDWAFFGRRYPKRGPHRRVHVRRAAEHGHGRRPRGKGRPRHARRVHGHQPGLR